MHDLHGGLAKDAAASSIVDLLEAGHLVDEFGNQFETKDVALQAVTLDFKLWCKECNIKSPPCSFTLSNLGRESLTVYPELASTFKHAHVKIILSFLAELTRTLGLTDTMSKIRATMLWAVTNFLNVLDRSGRCSTHAIKTCFEVNKNILYFHAIPKTVHACSQCT